MVPLVPNINFDNEDLPIRNNEPNSQFDDEQSHSDQNQIDIDNNHRITKLQKDSKTLDRSSRLGNGLLTPDHSILEDNIDLSSDGQPLNLLDITIPVNLSDIDERNFLAGLRTQLQRKNSIDVNQKYLATILNIFVVGQARPLQRLHKLELRPPPKNWRELKMHPWPRNFLKP